MNLLLQRPRNRRLVLDSAGIPTVIDLSCQEHTFSVRVRVMSEYGKFRRADLEPHFPLRLGARLLQPSPKGLTLKRNDSGQVRDCGHGEIQVTVAAASSNTFAPLTGSVTIEVEIFVQGPARSKVLSVLTPRMNVQNDERGFIPDVSATLPSSFIFTAYQFRFRFIYAIACSGGSAH